MQLKKKVYVQFLSLVIPGMRGPFVFDDDFHNWSLTFNLIIMESCVQSLTGILHMSSNEG